MKEETTQDMSDGRSFEERVFARFDALDGRLNAIDQPLTTLEERVDRRLHETRPIWEQVLARLDAIETETRNGFRRLSREIGVLGKDTLEVRAAQEDLEVRMDKLEERNIPQ